MAPKGLIQPPLSAEERRKLVEAPIIIRTIGGRGWGGASFAHVGLGLRTRRRSVYLDGDDSNTNQEYTDADTKS